MRVAILTWGLPPRGSGLGRAAAEIARSLRARGCDVVLFDADTSFGKVRDFDGLTVIGCAPSEHGIAGFLRRRLVVGHLVAPWHFRRALLAVHQAKPFDIVEATNWYAPAALLAGGKVALVVRNSTPASDTKSEARNMRDRLDLWFASLMEKLTARRASGLISNTPSHADLITKLYGIEKKNLHQVVSLALDSKVLERGSASALPAEHSQLSLLFIGRAERRKGFDEMLSGSLLANKARREKGLGSIALTIVGVDASDVACQLKRVGCNSIERAQITVRNGLSDDALHAEYGRATAVIAPSRYESFGLVYREAAAFGRPLIACAEDPAAVDFIEATDCGLLAEACTPRAIAGAINQLFETPGLVDRLGQNGKHHAALLSVERLAQETSDVYAQVITTRRRSSDPVEIIP